MGPTGRPTLFFYQVLPNRRLPEVWHHLRRAPVHRRDALHGSTRQAQRAAGEAAAAAEVHHVQLLEERGISINLFLRALPLAKWQR